MTTGRITFPGNPWPLGHALTEFTMTLRGGEDEVRLHLDAASEPFDAKGPGRPAPDAPADAWESPATWVAHDGAMISSTRWAGNAGVEVKVHNRLQFDERDLSGTWTADPVSDFDPNEPVESRAFGAYVLGSAAVADHEITIERTGPNRFDLRWTGKLARTWIGQTSFDHEFVVEVRDARLS